jgi:hypothetical protein
VIAPEVSELFNACPFLANAIDVEDLDLPTVVIGSVGRLLIDHKLAADQECLVFAYLNDLAERANAREAEILGTGALELFNDNAEAQRLGRSKFQGRALRMMEEFRRAWGQPDYASGTHDG